MQSYEKMNEKDESYFDKINPNILNYTHFLKTLLCLSG